MTKYPSHLTSLIEIFKKLPGVGQRSAERFAFEILNWPENMLSQFADVVKKTASEIHFCPQCYAMAQKNNCMYCSDSQRNKQTICVVGHAKDIFAIEDSHIFEGVYHVLGGLLSPSSGFDTSALNLQKLYERIEEQQVTEIIFALDSTVEGDATTLFLKNELQGKSLKISRLAFGMPVGSSLDFVDSSTLSRAFAGRQGF